MKRPDFLRSPTQNPERLTFFSDAVVAIAITLLVLDLHAPNNLSGPELHREVLALLPNLGCFALSFKSIATLWRVHHWQFDQLEKIDDIVVRLNFWLLFCIVLLPFPTSLLGRNGVQPLTMGIYSCSVAAAYAISFTLFTYARWRGLLKPKVQPKEARYTSLSSLLPAIFFGLASLTGFRGWTTLTIVLWVATIPTRWVLHSYFRLFERPTPIAEPAA